jgi:hypothetical protein
MHLEHLLLSDFGEREKEVGRKIRKLKEMKVANEADDGMERAAIAAAVVLFRVEYDFSPRWIGRQMS